MEAKRNVFLQQVRALHRDVGHLTVGLTIVFALSGLAQIFRDTDFLQHEVQAAVMLEPGLAADALGPRLRVRDFKVLRTEGSVVYFPGGRYDAATGAATRTEKRWIFPFDRLTSLHKAPSKQAVHWLTLLYGTLLLFMAVSSFFMFKAGTPLQKRGLVLSGAGFALALLVLFLLPGA